MSVKDLRNQVNDYKEEIAKIESLVHGKKLLAIKEISAIFSSKFEEVLSELRKKMNKDDNLYGKVLKLENEKKVEKNALKALKKEIKLLYKRKKKEIKQKLILIEHEKKKSIEILKGKIKFLQKQIKTLEVRKFAKKWKKWSKL